MDKTVLYISKRDEGIHYDSLQPIDWKIRKYTFFFAMLLYISVICIVLLALKIHGISLTLQSSKETLILSSCVRRMSESIDKRFCFDITADDR